MVIKKVQSLPDDELLSCIEECEKILHVTQQNWYRVNDVIKKYYHGHRHDNTGKNLSLNQLRRDRDTARSQIQYHQNLFNTLEEELRVRRFRNNPLRIPKHRLNQSDYEQNVIL